MIDYPGLITCTTCGAVTARQTIADHHEWHREHGHRPVGTQGDLDETLRLPPIGETIRRRPPVPVTLRELPAGSAELFRALADAIDGDEDLDTAERQLWPPCKSVDPAPGNRFCTWPTGTPCLSYGTPGCGMKAQES